MRHLRPSPLKQLTLWAMALLFVAASGCDTPTEVLCGPGVALDSLPNATLFTCENEEVDLLDFVKSHEVTYITFGALWCTACQKEVGIINEEVVAHFDAEKVGVIQILVEDDVDAPPSLAVCSAWDADLAPEFLLLTDLNQVTLGQHFPDGISTLPYHLIVTGDGFIRYEALGPMNDDLVNLLEPWVSAP